MKYHIYEKILEIIDDSPEWSRLIINEGVVRNIIIYGPISTFRIWLEKTFTSDKVVKLFEILRESMNNVFDEFHKSGVSFNEKYINKVEFDNLLNDAIFNCLYNKKYNNAKMSSDKGKCVVEYFLDIQINILQQIFYEVILLLQDADINITNIRNTKDFQNIKLDEKHKLYELLNKINIYLNDLLNFLQSKEFNKYLTFSRIKKAIIDSNYRIETYSQIDQNILKVINQHDTNIKKIRSF